jgi:hypothetical protein
MDAEEGRDVLTVDIPNAFVQTDLDIKKEQVIRKIRGILLDMLVDVNPKCYCNYVVYERKNKVLYVQMLKALYGMIQSALLFYKKFRIDVEQIGFKVNDYDPCVSNCSDNGTQHTVTWHVDNVIPSHKDFRVNDKFYDWLESMYGNPKIVPVKATQGKVHEYLPMKLDYSTPGVVKVNLTEYIKGMIKECPEQLLDSSKNCPWNENLFKMNSAARPRNIKKSQVFHTFVAKALFLSKRARCDIQPAIAFLTTQVRYSNEDDWDKHSKMMHYLKHTKKMYSQKLCGQSCF